MKLKGEGKTAILASYEADYLTLYDRIALMGGGIMAVGTPEKILGNPELLRSMISMCLRLQNCS